ncbi:MAG TPA: ankyrin repeat domain-containing protein [Flavisolibacter sp.]|nr:ankyrin repeat domain-containing protein [Flavisolibacter sp.]
MQKVNGDITFLFWEHVKSGDIPAFIDFLCLHRNEPDLLNLLGNYKTGPVEALDCIELAKQIILKEHQFKSLTSFQLFRQHLQEHSYVGTFEKAVEAVIYGDLNTLKYLIKEKPGLCYQRSRRLHHCTLLNYIGANGFEYFRQKTPDNAVEVARLLLSAGATVDAVADLYGGTTTLGLVATSIHPYNAGVQKELIDILLEHGANPQIAIASSYKNGRLIASCIANSRLPAAIHLAQKGINTDLEEAAGIGDLERVTSYFNGSGLINGATEQQRDAGFSWACGFGHMDVVRFMLEKGLNLNVTIDGMTALHRAVTNGHLDVVELLLSRSAPLEVENSYGGSVLDNALWAAYNTPAPAHPVIIKKLIDAGAIVKPEWNQFIEKIMDQKVS